MYVYSGKCRLCECGLPTNLKDDCDEELRTGDIVMSYTVTNDFGVANFGRLTVVVADHFLNVSGREPVELSKKEEPFVMGIKSCRIDDHMEKFPRGVWRVRRLKKFEDVVDGEHWQAFGFSYSLT